MEMMLLKEYNNLLFLRKIYKYNYISYISKYYNIFQ